MTHEDQKEKMKGVIDDIRVESHGDDQWKLLEDFDWYGITVPKGFITDFASIPRAFWSILNPVGKIKPAALVHDFIYSKRGKLDDRTLSRKDCDKIFLKIMKTVGLSWFKRTTAYNAVRVFGGFAWRSGA